MATGKRLPAAEGQTVERASDNQIPDFPPDHIEDDVLQPVGASATLQLPVPPTVTGGVEDLASQPGKAIKIKDAASKPKHDKKEVKTNMAKDKKGDKKKDKKKKGKGKK